MHNSMRQVLLCLVAVFAALSVGSTAWAQDKVVYHIDNAETQATKGLRNIRNHLDVAPDTKIVVVTHSDGVDFLFQDAKDKKNPNVDYGSLVSCLQIHDWLVTFPLPHANQGVHYV
jgi:hypothetical protein